MLPEVVGGPRGQLLLGEGQILAERLDLEFGQLDGQLEGVAGGGQAVEQDGVGRLEPAGPAVEAGEVAVGRGPGRVFARGAGAAPAGLLLERVGGGGAAGAAGLRRACGRPPRRPGAALRTSSHRSSDWVKLPRRS